MKQISNKTITSAFFILGILLLSNTAFAKLAYEKKKTVVKEFDVSQSQTVSLKHSRGDIEVKYFEGNKAKLEANLLVEGDQEEDLETLLSQYRLEVSEDSEGYIVNSTFNICNWSQSNFFSFWEKFRMSFKDGTVIKTKVKIVNAELILWIPRVKKLTLENKYDNLKLGDLPFDVEAKVFSGDFNSGNIEGNLILDIRYGSAKAGNLKNGIIELFNAKLDMRNAEYLNLISKYSDIKMQNIDSLNLEIFEGKIILGNVKTSLNIEGKYASIKTGQVAKGKWELFECDVEMEGIQTLSLKDKYGDYKLGKSGHLNVICFESDFDIKSVETIYSDKNKYTNFHIELLETSFISKESFEEDIKIKKTGSNLTEVNINGKYGKLILELPSEYQLDFDMKYGIFDYQLHSLDVNQLVKDDSDYRLLAKSKGAGESASLIKVRGFEMRVDPTKRSN